MDSKLFCHEGVKSQKEEIEANFFGICPSHRVGQAGRIAPVGDFRVRPAEIVELSDRLEPQIPVNGHGSGVVLQHLQQILSDARPP